MNVYSGSTPNWSTRYTPTFRGEPLIVESPMINTDRLEARMAELGLNPYSTAKKAGLGPDYVRDLLRGKVKQPSAVRLRDLAIALDCSPDFLIGLSDETGDRPLSWSSTSATAARLSVEWVIRDGFFEDAKALKPRVHRARWAVSALDYGDEWLEYVETAQLNGEIPAGVYVHVVSMDHYYEGLTDIFVSEMKRDGGALVGRRIRRALGRQGKASPFPEDYTPSLVDRARASSESGTAVGAVIRFYRFFDHGATLDDMPEF